MNQLLLFKRIPTSLFLTLAALVLLLSAAGCGAIGGITPAVRIDFYQDNQWRVWLQASAPASSSTAIEQIDATVGEMIQRVKENQVKYTYKREQVATDMVYTLEFTGMDLKLLSEIIFEKQAVIKRIDSNGRQVISFALPQWKGKEGINHIDLNIRGGAILDGNGEPSSRPEDEWAGMQWNLSSGRTLDVALLPWSCVNQAGSSIAMDFLPDGYWVANLGLTPPGDACPADAIKTEMEPLLKFFAQSGAYAAWDTTEASSILHLLVYGQGAESLSRGLFNGYGQAEYPAFDSRKVSFSLPARPKTGYRLSALGISGAEVTGNGSAISATEMAWEDFSQEMVADVTSYPYLHLADTNLTVDFLAGQRWRALFEMAAPLYYADWEGRLRAEVQALAGRTPTGSQPATYTCQNTSNILRCQLDREGSGYTALSQGLFSGAAMISANDAGWSRQVVYRQVREMPWGFHTLMLNLRGGEILDGSGISGSDRGDTRVHPGSSETWSKAQVMLWQNPGLNTYARLKERFVWDLPALTDTAQLWGQKLLPAWPLALVLVPLIGAAALLLAFVLIAGNRKARTQKAIPFTGSQPVERPTSHPSTTAPYSAKTTAAVPIVDEVVVENPLHGELVLPDGRRIALPVIESFVVGSDPGCDLSLRGDGAAPRHAALHHARLGYYIENISREKPLLVNGAAVQKSQWLHHQDVIQVGSTEMRFRMDGFEK